MRIYSMHPGSREDLDSRRTRVWVKFRLCNIVVVQVLHGIQVLRRIVEGYAGPKPDWNGIHKHFYYYADPDVWIRAAFKPAGRCRDYYKMVLIYVHNILHLSHNTKPVIGALTRTFYELKVESCGPPAMYLGGRWTDVLVYECT